jgi:hypothetical protein
MNTMPTEQYEAMKAELEDRWRKAKAKADTIKKALDGFEITYKMLGERSGGGSKKRGEAHEVIGAVVAQMTDTFTVKTVIELLENNHPDTNIARTTVSSVLTSFVKDGLIELRTTGKGRSPNVYRVKRDDSDESEDDQANELRMAQ